jgi:dynein intermediate chain 4, axonemal
MCCCAGGVLAVGDHSGSVSVYDIKARNACPIITSDGSAGKHLDPVWKVQWIDNGPVASTLVSISTDGRITRWHITKGLEYDDLMKLKRTVRRAAAPASQKAGVVSSVRQEAFISRLTAGMALDFSTHDERIYLAGESTGPH